MVAFIQVIFSRVQYIHIFKNSNVRGGGGSFSEYWSWYKSLEKSSHSSDNLAKSFSNTRQDCNNNHVKLTVWDISDITQCIWWSWGVETSIAEGYILAIVYFLSSLHVNIFPKRRVWARYIAKMMIKRIIVFHMFRYYCPIVYKQNDLLLHVLIIEVIHHSQDQNYLYCVRSNNY